MESSLRRTKREQQGRFVPKPGSRNSRSNLPRDAVYGDQYPGLSILPGRNLKLFVPLDILEIGTDEDFGHVPIPQSVRLG